MFKGEQISQGRGRTSKVGLPIQSFIRNQLFFCLLTFDRLIIISEDKELRITSSLEQFPVLGCVQAILVFTDNITCYPFRVFSNKTHIFRSLQSFYAKLPSESFSSVSNCLDTILYLFSDKVRLSHPLLFAKLAEGLICPRVKSCSGRLGLFLGGRNRVLQYFRIHK